MKGIILFLSLATQLVFAHSNELTKRAQFLHCDEAPIPQNINAAVSAFTTLQSLCTTRTKGMGYFCNRQGVMVLGEFGELFNYQLPPVSLQDLCMENCRCYDIMPPEPEIDRPVKRPRPNTYTTNTQSSAKPADQASSSQQDSVIPGVAATLGACQLSGTCQDSENVDVTDTVVHCGRIFGRPNKSDCAAVLQQVAQKAAQATAQGVQVIRPDGVHSMNPIIERLSLPQTFRNGNCAATIMPGNGSLTGNELVSWPSVLKTLNSVKTQCDGRSHFGGSNVPGLGSTHDTNLTVVLYGPTAKLQTYLNQEHNCTDPDSRDLACGQPKKGDTQPNRMVNLGSSPQFKSDPAKSVYNSCYSADDCDVTNDFICATEVKDHWSLDSSWGRFSCKHVVNMFASMAVVQTYTKCRGRCLMETEGPLNGSFRVQEAFNVTIGAGDASSQTIQIPKTNGTRDQTSEVSVDTTAALARINAARLEGQVCPCNCTYASPPCCLSPLVYEDPSNNRINLTEFADPDVLASCKNSTQSSSATESIPMPASILPRDEPRVLGIASPNVTVSVLPNKVYYTEALVSGVAPTATSEAEAVTEEIVTHRMFEDAMWDDTFVDVVNMTKVEKND